MTESLRVVGESDAGWCAATPPNETADEDGRPLIRTVGFTAADPRAPARRVYDDPEVVALREHLRGSQRPSRPRDRRTGRGRARHAHLPARWFRRGARPAGPGGPGHHARGQRPGAGPDSRDSRGGRPQIHDRERAAAASLQLWHGFGLAAAAARAGVGRDRRSAHHHPDPDRPVRRGRLLGGRRRRRPVPARRDRVPDPALRHPRDLRFRRSAGAGGADGGRAAHGRRAATP